jgi:uncharacterized membrane protein
MTIETSKNLGGVGLILLFIGVIPWTWPYGWVLALVGLILALIGFKGLADYYREANIFNNALYTVILAVIGVVVFAGLLVIAAVGLLAELGIDAANIAEWSAGTSQLSDMTVLSGVLGEFLAQILLAAVVLWVCLIIGAVFLRKSLGVVSAKSGVGLFGTTGLLMLIGAIIPIIGLLLMWIGLLLLAVAFFFIKAQPTASAEAPTQV